MTPEQILQVVKRGYSQLEERAREDGWAFWVKNTNLRILRASRRKGGSTLVLSVSEKLGMPNTRDLPFYGDEAALQELLDQELANVGALLSKDEPLRRKLKPTIVATANRWATDRSTSIAATDRSGGNAASRGDLVKAVTARMLGSARAACARSGKPQTVTAKTKLFRLEGEEAVSVVTSLLDLGTCAVTKLELDLSGADQDLAPSLDRIDPNGHYELGNVQVVAWFVNRWKSDDSQANFERLLSMAANSVFAYGTR